MKPEAAMCVSFSKHSPIGSSQVGIDMGGLSLPYFFEAVRQ
jgi:hypothetical protein